ncbi:MAG TPA: hypothetical protein PKK43_06370, partial [Spirochaetota bacterium]|nr:hypothetical protein [Spirochaetota bacterium]
MRNTIVILLFICLSIPGFADTKKAEPESLYVSPISGLLMRENPSLSSKTITLVPYGTCLAIERTSDKDEVINGIKSKWAHVNFNNFK